MLFVSQLRVSARFQSVGFIAIADTLIRISFSPTVGMGRSSALMVLSAWTMTARWVFGTSNVDILMVSRNFLTEAYDKTKNDNP